MDLCARSNNSRGLSEKEAKTHSFRGQIKNV
jgi:hypothetical protein